MLLALGWVGAIIISVISFMLGKVFAESEKILAEKRALYRDFLTSLLPLNDTYRIVDAEDFRRAMAPSVIKGQALMLYADPQVALACGSLFQNYWAAFSALTPESPPLAPEIQELMKAQNDLVLEMKRDAFRFSIFSYHGVSRVKLANTASL